MRTAVVADTSTASDALHLKQKCLNALLLYNNVMLRFCFTTVTALPIAIAQVVQSTWM